MDLEMVLNELSLYPPADDIQTARQRMSDIISTLSAATRGGVKNVLRTHDDLSYVFLAPDYPLVKWRNDSNVSREARSFFRALMTKSPLLVDVVNPEINNKNAMSQFWHQDVDAKGLGIAHLLDALAISLMSDPRWNSSYLELTSIELNDDGELGDKSKIDVVHASRREHIVEHAGWISERKEHILRMTQATVQDGADLWMRKEELFPHLQFCGNVEGQLQDVLHGQLLLQSIIKKLLEFDMSCNHWLSGPFDSQRLASKATTESTTTLQRFGRERTFLCPDGEARLFTWHIRLTPDAWRIYFYPEEEKQSLIIGHVGPHLPTVKYPT